MPWFKVDDSWWGHPKRVATPLAAVGLWVNAGSWCAQQMSDGYVPKSVLPLLGGKPKDAQALVDAGLWIPVKDGWEFHDWAKYQPARADVQKRRDANAERLRKWRQAKEAERPPLEAV